MSSKPPVTLDHVHLFCSDLAATVRFFRDLFGATLVWDEEAAGVRNVRLALGLAFVNLYEQPPRRPGSGTVHHVGLATTDLDALVAHLATHGVRLRKPVREEPGFRYAMVEGPDGLLIELFESREPARWGVQLG